MNPWGIVLDADVFLRSSARDLFLYLAVLGVVSPVWSERILEEVARNFPTGRERFAPLLAGLDRTFPEALKTGFEHRIALLALTSEKDRHVLALAAEYEADLVSFNHRHFDPTEARDQGVRVYPPDDALERLVSTNPREVREAAERAFIMLRKPPVGWADYIARIRDDGMPKIAAWLSAFPAPRRPRP